MAYVYAGTADGRVPVLLRRVAREDADNDALDGVGADEHDTHPDRLHSPSRDEDAKVLREYRQLGEP